MRKKILHIDADEVTDREQSPERTLFIEIINRALEDARGANAYGKLIQSKGSKSGKGSAAEAVELARDAMEFLLTDRCDPYLHILEIDPEVFRECLVRTQHSECTTPPAISSDDYSTSAIERRTTRLAVENKKRRMFRNNYRYFKEYQERVYNERKHLQERFNNERRAN